MYRDTSGNFVCRYWGLRKKKHCNSIKLIFLLSIETLENFKGKKLIRKGKLITIMENDNCSNCITVHNRMTFQFLN